MNYLPKSGSINNSLNSALNVSRETMTDGINKSNEFVTSGARYFNEAWQSLPEDKKRIIKYAGLGATVPVVGAGGLYLIGFTPGGVGAGSLATAWQSSIGNVAAGRLFAGMQSAGATLTGPGLTLLAAKSGAVAGAAYEGVWQLHLYLLKERYAWNVCVNIYHSL